MSSPTGARANTPSAGGSRRMTRAPGSPTRAAPPGAPPACCGSPRAASPSRSPPMSRARPACPKPPAASRTPPWPPRPASSAPYAGPDFRGEGPGPGVSVLRPATTPAGSRRGSRPPRRQARRYRRKLRELSRKPAQKSRATDGLSGAGSIQRGSSFRGSLTREETAAATIASAGNGPSGMSSPDSQASNRSGCTTTGIRS